MYYSLFVHREIDDDGNPWGGAIAALQFGVGAPPPPPTPALQSAVPAAASAPTNVAFPLPTTTPAVVSASANPAPSQIAFPTAQAVDPSSAQVLTADTTGFTSGQVSQTDQQHQMSVPRMTPGQFHSSRYFCSSLESVF